MKSVYDTIQPEYTKFNSLPNTLWPRNLFIYLGTSAYQVSYAVWTWTQVKSSSVLEKITLADLICVWKRSICISATLTSFLNPSHRGSCLRSSHAVYPIAHIYVKTARWERHSEPLRTFTDSPDSNSRWRRQRPQTFTPVKEEWIEQCVFILLFKYKICSWGTTLLTNANVEDSMKSKTKNITALTPYALFIAIN